MDFNKKSKLVNDVFSSVANKYDIMNDIMSFGAHRLWKKEFMKFLPDKSLSLLDVAGGSGDISYQYLSAAKRGNLSPSITLCDVNQDMLSTAKDKFVDKGILQGIDLVAGDATNLPFASDEFDYYTISFGIRNVDDITAALSEAYRVLKPGGKFVCMEFSSVEDKILSKLYDVYSFSVIPKVGEIITQNSSAYQYLVESIRKFPNKEVFLSMLEDNFHSCGYKSMSFGAVAIHYGYKFTDEKYL